MNNIAHDSSGPGSGQSDNLPRISARIRRRIESGRVAAEAAQDHPVKRGLDPVRRAPGEPSRSDSLTPQELGRRTRIAKKYGTDDLFAEFLVRRGFAPGKRLDSYLAPLVTRELPSIRSLKEGEKAVRIIEQALLSGKKIAICCDYDADGTTAGAILARTIRGLGGAAVVYSPDRSREGEGYGLNPGMIHRAKAEGCELIVTLDFGTKNEKELELARTLGIPSIVIDHHHAPEKGRGEHPATALVNPKQKGCGFSEQELCTAGLSWVVSRALVGRYVRGPDIELRKLGRAVDLNALLAIAAIGTIGDMVPLRGANRAIVAEGLFQFSETELAGLVAFKEVCKLGVRVTAEDIGFKIAPRLNAFSRMARNFAPGDSAGQTMVELLTTDSLERARELAAVFHDLNEKRKESQRKIEEELTRELMTTAPDEPAVIVSRKEYNGGVLGIVASRIAERFNRPAFLMKEGENGLCTGSARSVPGVHLAKLLEEIEPILVKAGGHEQAAGFTLHRDRLPEFRRAVNRVVSRMLRGRDTTPQVKTDMELTLPDLQKQGVEFIQQLNRIEPSDRRSNPPFTGYVRDAVVVSTEVVGTRHLKVWLRQGETTMYAMLWFETDHPAISPGAQVNLAVKLKLNDRNAQYNRAKQRVQLEILAAKGSAPVELRQPIDPAA